MRRASVLALLIAAAACSGPPPGPEQRRAATDELDPSGRAPAGPSVVTANPPGDNNGARLQCHLEGPGTVCNRPNRF